MILFANRDSERFMEKVAKSDTGCWQWTSTLDHGGYGKFWFRGAQFKAHRVAYELFKGDSSSGWVLHKCDNRKCVNPEHLYLGDAKQNARDRTERKRYRVMTPFKVVCEVREKYAAGSHTQQQLADLYGIKQTQVSRYVSGKQRLSL